MNLLVLTYHYFDRGRPYGIKDEDRSYSVTAETLEAHCRQLAEAPHQIIDPTQLETLAQEPDGRARQILITIDDGHQSVGDIALEPLLKYGLRAIVNVVVDSVGREHYLSWSSLRDLAAKGFSIQSHSMRHRFLTRLSPPELRSDLETSRKTIEDNVGLPVTMLAVPMGRINRTVIDAATAAGYTVIMTSYTGINTTAGDMRALHRFQVKRAIWILPLEQYYRPLSLIRVTGAAKNAAKIVRDRLR